MKLAVVGAMLLAVWLTVCVGPCAPAPALPKSSQDRVFHHTHLAVTADGAGLVVAFAEVVPHSIPPSASVLVRWSGPLGDATTPARAHSYPDGGHESNIYEAILPDLSRIVDPAAASARHRRQATLSYTVGVETPSPSMTTWLDDTTTEVAAPRFIDTAGYQSARDAYAAAACGSHAAAAAAAAPAAAPAIPVKSLTLGLVADTSVLPRARDTLATMAAWSPSLDAVLHLGDYGYADQADREPWNVARPLYAQTKQRYWDAFMAMIEGLASHVPFVTVRGNHEAGVFDSPLSYPARFFRPQDPDRTLYHAALAAETGPETWYALRLSPMVSILVLDSERPLQLGSPQAVFAQAHLARLAAAAPRPGHFSLVLIHRSVYSASLHKGSNLELRAALEDVLAPYPGAVDFVFCGHDHSAEFTHPVFRGSVASWTVAPIHVRLGVGGLETRQGWNDPLPPWSAAQFGDVFGFVALTVHSNGTASLELVESGTAVVKHRAVLHRPHVCSSPTAPTLAPANPLLFVAAVGGLALALALAWTYTASSSAGSGLAKARQSGGLSDDPTDDRETPSPAMRLYTTADIRSRSSIV